jgi:Na+-driven multidrug efflux pump
MAAPLVVSFWMRAAFTLVDTVYAATVGDAAVAAIGLTVPFEYLMIALWVGLSTGLTSALSRAMGSHEGGKITQYLRASWVLVLWLSPLFALVGGAIWFAAPRIGLASDVGWSFAVYGSVLIGGSAFTAFWSIIPDSLIKAHQDTRSTMWAGIWSNLINVTLNTVFVFVFGWGIFGIAFSTVLGRIGGLVYAVVRARHHEERRKSGGDYDLTRTDPRPYRTILSLAVPSSLTFVLMAGETGIVNALLATLDNPTESIAAYSIYFRVAMFMFNPVIAAAVASLPYMARRFGEGDLDGVRRGLREVGIAVTVYSLAVAGPIMLVASRWVAEALAEVELTARYAQFGLLLVPLTCLAGAPFLICRPVFEAMQRGKPGLLMGTLRYAVLTFPAGWLGIRIAQGMGQPGLYGLVIALHVVAAITSGLFFAWLHSALRHESRAALGHPSTDALDAPAS